MRGRLRTCRAALPLLLALGSVTAAQRQGPRTPVSLSQPRKDGQLECTVDAGSLYKCIVSGTVTNLTSGQRLLLWVRPVQPPSESEGWYLQRRPNGLIEQSAGSWRGQLQVGSRDFPPRDGDVIDVAVSLADGATADRLMQRSGVVIEREPVGGTIGRSDNVRLRIRRS